MDYIKEESHLEGHYICNIWEKIKKSLGKDKGDPSPYPLMSCLKYNFFVDEKNININNLVDLIIQRRLMLKWSYCLIYLKAMTY